ncbi:hypothetical protein FOCC_FOCC015077 [Frankliniella occidentalis]|nr:hypothetical protein FOCC_FOCC015077 [Frankliniella occidentalis]
MSARISYEQCSQDVQFEYFCGLTNTQFTHLENLVSNELFKYLKYRNKRPTPKYEKPTKKLVSLKCKLFVLLVRLRRGFTSGFTEKWLAYFLEAKTLTCSPQQLNRPSPNQLVLTLFQMLDVWLTVVRLRFNKRPSNFALNGTCFSDFKGPNAVKVPIAVTLRGAVSFLSERFEGSTADKEIFLKCGITDFLEPEVIVLW